MRYSSVDTPFSRERVVDREFAKIDDYASRVTFSTLSTITTRAAPAGGGGSFVIAVATTPLDPTNMGIKRQEQEDKHDRRSIRWGNQKDRGVFFGKNMPHARLTS